jgi:predicted O-methyltransferase YrrM
VILTGTVDPRARIDVFRLLFAVCRVPQKIRNYRNMKRDLQALREQYSNCASLEEQVGLVCAHQVFRSDQRGSEIVDLLRLLGKEPPRYVCEIGAALGGTLFLLTRICRPDALLISVDLRLAIERSLIHLRFARGKQRIVGIRGNSRAAETVRKVRLGLRGEPLDLLFIDGDHEYEAVKSDFTNYGPLVRPGGLIVLHDIVRDFYARYGRSTGFDTGGVPMFWEEIKGLYRTTELIEDPEQDGFGIGIIHR